MQAKSILTEIVDTIDLQSEDFSGFVSKKTGEAILISNEHINLLEEGNDYSDCPDWEKESIELTLHIYQSDDYIELPSQYEIHEYKIMEDYCYSLPNNTLQEAMLNAIKGSGAFRRFKNNIAHYNIEKSWYEFKQKELEKITYSWCISNKIPLE